MNSVILYLNKLKGVYLMNKKMKALVLNEPYNLSYEELDVPPCPEGYALLKIRCISICGSDIHAYRGNQPLMVYPRILGHELCGTVVEIRGESQDICIGDKVSVMPYVYCGKCVTCQQGRTNCCTSLEVLGVHIHGGISEYLSIPIENIMKVPSDMDDMKVALIEPLAVSAHSVKRGNIQRDDHLLVLGAGPIGLGAAEIAKTYGAHVILADTSEIRRNFAHRQLGYDVLNPFDPGYSAQLKALTQGNFPNKIIDSTGNQKSMAKAIDCLGYGGTIVFVGLQGGTLDISDPEFHKREANILASRVALPSDFAYVIDCIRRGKIHPEKFITNIADFDQAKESLENWIEKGAEVFKGVIRMKP
jgi:2-desacetyl-2-hydroxyethyl bacteriochlorophyllide A dehydrogenase